MGVRCTMEWRIIEGVDRMRGMWKTFADMLEVCQYTRSVLLISLFMQTSVVLATGNVVEKGERTHSLRRPH